MCVCVLEIVGMDADIQREFSRQREHLEHNVASLKRKLAKDTEVHRIDNVKIMKVQACHPEPSSPGCEAPPQATFPITLHRGNRAGTCSSHCAIYTTRVVKERNKDW